MSSTHSMMHGLQPDNSYGSDKTRCEESWLMKSAFLLSGRGCWYDNGRNCKGYGSVQKYGIQSTFRERQDWRRYKGKDQRVCGRQSEAENQSTNNLAVVLPNDAYTTNAPFFQECLLGISEVAAALQYHVLITAGALNDTRDIKMLVEEQKIDGIILLRGVENDSVLKYLTDRHFPTGLTGSCKYEEILQVDADHYQAAASLMSVLIGQGYRKFAFVAGDMQYRVNQNRSEGCYAALKQYGLDMEQQCYYTDFRNSEPIENYICDMIEKKVECIVCADDVICTRFMSCLQAQGYRIPDDIGIVSLCNSASLECFTPAVTAVNVSARQMGNVIGRQMINRLRGESYNAKTTLNHEILLRKSADRGYRI